MTPHLRLICLSACLLAASQHAQALNYFDLEVYPYKTAARGELELENGTTYTSQGPKSAGDDIDPAGQTRNRSTFEAVYGVTDKTEIAGYLDYARAADGGYYNAGQRIRTRTRFYEKGELPVDLGLYAELEAPNRSINSKEFELRGIVEKDLGKWTFDLNPILEKPLRGLETSNGWELHYAASVIYRADWRWKPHLDFFGDFGPVQRFDTRDNQKHLISPAIDVRLNRRLSFGVGVAYGLTKASEQRLIRTRLELEFY